MGGRPTRPSGRPGTFQTAQEAAAFGKAKASSCEVLVILAEESGLSLSLSIIYPSDSRRVAPYLQQAPGIKSCAYRRAVEDHSETSPGASLVQQDLRFFV